MDSEGILSEAQEESIKSKNYETRVDYSQKIKELQEALDKEISELENINYDDIQDDEIQKQNKEIEILKKQIEENNIEKDYNECEEQFKILDNFKKDLEKNFNSYEELINKEINDLKINLNNQTNKQFEDILREINEINGNIKSQKSINKQLNIENENNHKNLSKDIPIDNNDDEKEINNNKESPKDNIKESNNKNKDKDSLNDSNFNNKSFNKDNPNDNSFYFEKEINNKNQINDNNFTFNQKRVSKNNNVKRIKCNINSNNENQNNDKKKENINNEGPFDKSKAMKKDYNFNYSNENNIINDAQMDNNNIYDSNRLNNFRNSNKSSNILNNRKDITNEKKKDGACKIKYANNETKNRNDNPSKKENENQKIYQSINNIFFYDYQQKYIKDTKINDCQKEELQKEIFNDKIKGRNILKNYYMNYIEKIILPLFKKNKNIIQSKLDTIKYNISVILECLGMDKNYYNNHYYQYETKKKNVNRAQSQEALIRFRKEFKISKEDFTDEAIEKKLIDNDLDIYKTFGIIFG